ncbi:MAG: 5-formyltetrahydrofolate cyclo-ligase [Syntrophotaleaceae bacterium]
MPKKSIRAEVLTRRRHLAAETCLRWSLSAQERLLESSEFRRAAAVALYSPVQNEVFTEMLFHQAVQHGKLVTYPRVRGSELEFVQVDESSNLQPGAFGVLEPRGDRVVETSRLDLVVVPGVAYDREGHRLGYGKGFYDRCLHGKRRPRFLAGLCFELQIVNKLPAEAHDVRMDMVMTENCRYDFPHAAG